MSRLPVPVLLSGTLLGGYAALYALGGRAGSTAAERAAALPGDDLVDDPQIVTNHAATIQAGADSIWPWLAQMGWHLGGYYTPDWVDRLLFPGNWPSLDRLDPDLARDLRPGDTIPDGPPGTAEHIVAQADPPHLLVTRSTTHLPPGWAERYGARMAWTWCFRLTPTGDERTRVQLRVRGTMSPAWVAALYRATIVPADFVMAAGMLHGLKARAEGGAAPEASGRAPLAVR